MAITVDLRDIDAAIEREVLALNNAHAAELSWLEEGELRRLLGEAYYARTAGACDAFMIGFDEGADYQSPNFRWFRERYPRFACRPRRGCRVGTRARAGAGALRGFLRPCGR